MPSFDISNIKTSYTDKLVKYFKDDKNEIKYPSEIIDKLLHELNERLSNDFKNRLNIDRNLIFNSVIEVFSKYFSIFDTEKKESFLSPSHFYNRLDISLK